MWGSPGRLAERGYRKPLRPSGRSPGVSSGAAVPGAASPAPRTADRGARPAGREAARGSEQIAAGGVTVALISSPSGS